MPNKKMPPGKMKAKTGFATKAELASKLARARKTTGRLSNDDIKRALGSLVGSISGAGLTAITKEINKYKKDSKMIRMSIADKAKKKD
tara:strand:- start:1987 stop:2250 length:264 start_codon:yes stop_codon:yes gene_type:complete